MILTRTMPDGSEQDFEIEVSYERSERIAAIPRGWDDPGEPASGGEVTIQAAWCDGAMFQLTDAEIEELEARLAEDEDGDSGYGDYMRDLMMDRSE